LVLVGRLYGEILGRAVVVFLCLLRGVVRGGCELGAAEGEAGEGGGEGIG
jgi:hypothetical protein